MAVEDRKRLHSQLETAFTRDEDQPLELARLLSSNRSPNCGAGGVSDAAIDSLRPCPAPSRKVGGEETGLGGAGFRDDEIAGFEERGQALISTVRKQTGLRYKRDRFRGIKWGYPLTGQSQSWTMCVEGEG